MHTPRKRWIVYSITLAAVPLLMVAAIRPAGASGPPETVVVDEFEFGEDVNPCTGETHTIFVSLTDRAHAFDNEAGDRHHRNVIGVFHVRTSDGFSGDLVSPDVLNLSGDTDTATFTMILVGIISNPDTGQRYRFRSRAHVIEVNGAPIVEDFTTTQTCLGRNGP